MFNITNWKIKRLTKKLRSMQANRVCNQPGDTVIKKEIDYCFELAGIYKRLIGSKKHPFAALMVIECYRAAASIQSDEAHYELGKAFIEDGKYRQQLINDGIFNSPENLKECHAVFELGHKHLLEAEKLNHIQAKRLRGLCLINGWGVDPEKDKGFELVVASIDQEESWDRVPQIFAAIGLNKPEFFAAIMQRKK